MKKIVVIMMIFLLCSCTLTNAVDDPFIQVYLTNKYGSDVTFEKAHADECNLLHMDECSAYYKASDAEDEIYIMWSKADGSDIKDDYLFKKYKKELVSYYTKLFDKVINSKYKLEVFSNKSDYKWEENLKFEDFIKYENLNSVISLHIASKDLDISSLAESIKTLLKNNKIKNVAAVYITTYNNGCSLEDVSKCKKINSSYIEIKIVEPIPEQK